MKRLTSHFSFIKNALFLSVWVIIIGSCSPNKTSNDFVGVWSPIRYEECDMFVISADSIIAIRCETKEKHLQCHYTILRDSIIKLERCWMTEGDFIVTESKMYFDEEGHLIINPFTNDGFLAEVFPNYSILKLKKYENK